MRAAALGPTDAPMPNPVPVPRPRPAIWAEPQSFREAAGPDFNSDDVTAKPTDCDDRLAKIAVMEPMPRLIGPGACGGGDMVRLDAVLLADKKRIEIKPGALSAVSDGGVAGLVGCATKRRRASARPVLLWSRSTPTTITNAAAATASSAPR